MGEEKFEGIPLDFNGIQNNVDIHAAWHILPPGCIDLQLVSSNLQRSLAWNIDTLHHIAQPGVHDAVLDRVNEGEFNGVFRLDCLDEDKNLVRQFAVTTAKDVVRGAKQIRTDANLLPKARENLAALEYPLRIPELYATIDVAILKTSMTIPANLLEWMPNYQEISMYDEGSNIVFDTNQASPLLQQEFLTFQEYSTALREQNRALHDIAQNQLFLYMAMGNRVQQNWGVNRGDYVATVRDGNLEWALITIQGGLTEPMTMQQFLHNLFTHTEHPFHPRFGMIPDKDLYPFAADPNTTLQGVIDGYTHNMQEADREEAVQHIKSSFAGALASIKVDVPGEYHVALEELRKT